MRTTVELAPKGMKRSLENATTWARTRRTINWQVEWIREEHAGRSLSKVMGNKPIGEAFADLLEEERKNLLTDNERWLEKKAKEKKAKLLRAATKSDGPFDLSSSATLQDPQTGAWASASALIEPFRAIGSTPIEPKPAIPDHHFYLHRPKTQSSYAKVLIPLNPIHPLEKLLRRRLVLEFPTIYVLKAGPDDLPEDDFMLERDYLSATRQPPWQDSDTEMRNGNESNSEEDPDSETSSSGSDSDDDAEEGEIAE